MSLVRGCITRGRKRDVISAFRVSRRRDVPRRNLTGAAELAHCWIRARYSRVLYRSLGLSRGDMMQVLGPRVFWRAAAATLRGHRLGAKAGDVWQMPGVFLVRDGHVLNAFRHRDVAERPDYRAIIARLHQVTNEEAGATSRRSSG